MKKIAAIFLIVILAFNWYGYRIVTSILSKKADQQLEERLDREEYEESQLLEIRIALNLPYQPDRPEFERHYGEIEVDGQYYMYVKRKVENGFLILKCIPNSDKERIRAAANDFVKLANCLEGNQPGKKQNNTASYAKNFWSEYYDRDSDHSVAALSGIALRQLPLNTSLIKDNYSSVPAQPPDAIHFTVC